jgi:Mg2+ and Co2+ transporter CorA
VIVDSAYYTQGTPGNEKPFGLAEARRRAREERGFVWVTLSDPTPEEMEELRVSFNLPALAVEDAQGRHERPKLDQHGEHVFLLVRTVRYDEARRAVGFGEIDLTREYDDVDETFRRSAAEHLERYAAEVPATAREELLRSLSYRQVHPDELVARRVVTWPFAESAWTSTTRATSPCT